MKGQGISRIKKMNNEADIKEYENDIIGEMYAELDE